MTYFNEFGQARLGWNVGTPISGGGGSTVDTDAQAFITAASITDSTQQSAINTLVTQLKTYGIWTKLKAVYPFVGGTASSHKFNLKDPRDLDAAYRLVFGGGWTHSSTGALPNGTTAYADTKLNQNNILQSNNEHFSVYLRTNSLATTVDGGLWNGFYGTQIFSRANVPVLSPNDIYIGYSQQNASVYSFVTNTDSRGLHVVNRSSSSVVRLQKNTTITSFNINTSGKVSLNFTLAARNNMGTPDLYSNREQAFASIGDGLTDAEATNFYTAVQTFQTTLGRQVGVPIVADSDAQAFLNAAVITDQTQANAINTLVTSLKSANIWTKMKAIYPFVGGTATTHKFNLKDPRDLDAAYRLVFNGGWTHSSTGALPNGTTGYANTYLNPATAISNAASAHFSLYCNTNTFPSVNGTVKVNGGYLSSPSPIKVFDLGFWRRNTGQGTYFVALGGDEVLIDSATPTTAGLNLVSRTSSSLLKFIQNNITLGSDTRTITTGLPGVNMYLGGRNGDNVVDSYNNLPHQFASMGDGLTDTEATAFYNAVQAYQVALSRQA